MEFNLLVDPQPEVQSNILLCAMSNVSLAFTRGSVSLDTGLDVSMLSNTILNSCPVLHAPRAAVVCSLHWLCDGSPYNHHAAQPTAPRLGLPASYDSYSLFRSHGLNMDVVVDLPEKCVLLLYSSTLAWLQRLDARLSELPCPIRHGKQFSAVVPPLKPSLGRHIGVVNLRVTCPDVSVVFFNSYERLRGLLVQGMMHPCFVFLVFLFFGVLLNSSSSSESLILCVFICVLNTPFVRFYS